ncbi:unnamed protein product [Boreogadus saida]
MPQRIPQHCFGELTPRDLTSLLGTANACHYSRHPAVRGRKKRWGFGHRAATSAWMVHPREGEVWEGPQTSATDSTDFRTVE